MNKLKSLRKIIFLVVILMGLKCVGGETRAATSSIIDTSRKASLTITLQEQQNGSGENKPLKGVEFTIYNMPSESGVETVEQGLAYLRKHAVRTFAQITPSSGTITYSDLDLGRYLVVQTRTPKNVSTKMESFLIDLPKTTEDGRGWDYDVTIYPKNITIYGNVTLTHTNRAGESLERTMFKIATSEENARNGIFVKNIENFDLVAETGREGYTAFKGLKYGVDGVKAGNAQSEYWIVEVQASSDKYSLMQNPKKVIVNSNSKDNLITIVNKEKLNLPLTGGKLNIIFIEKIKVNLPIYQGTDDKTLLKGIGHLEKTSMPTRNFAYHSVLVGYTEISIKKFFDDLPNLKVGDEFVVTILNEKFKYKIYKIKKVLPNQTKELKIQENRKLVTLVTCTPKFVNSHRLLVMGGIMN